MKSLCTQIKELYEKLFSFYGNQGWWPGNGLEIAIGALLTQHVNWINAKKALSNLKDQDCLNLTSLTNITLEELEKLIYPSGYYSTKARRIKSLVKLLSENPQPTREELLGVKGIGCETADSILNYMFEKPIFVVDAYTFRIMSRLGLYESKRNSYSELQNLFMNNLPKDHRLYNQYHALLVKHAKEHCHKSNPKCKTCPLLNFCNYQKQLKTLR